MGEPRNVSKPGTSPHGWPTVSGFHQPRYSVVVVVLVVMGVGMVVTGAVVGGAVVGEVVVAGTGADNAAVTVGIAPAPEGADSGSPARTSRSAMVRTAPSARAASNALRRMLEMAACMSESC